MQEKQKMNIKKLSSVKIIVIALLIISVIVFGSLSWFTMSKEVEGSGTQMTASDLPFEIRTKSNAGYYDTYLENYDEDTGKGYLKLSANQNMLTTNGKNTSIQWLVSENYHEGNFYQDGTKNEDLGIKPGSRGCLKFWVVPYEQETIKIKFILKSYPYQYNYETDSETGKLVFENGLPKENPPTVMTANSSVSDGTYEDIINVLDAHILYFQHFDSQNSVSQNETSGTYYGGFYDLIDDEFEMTITFEKDENGNLQEKEMAIYWVWPETLEEALVNNPNNPKCIYSEKDTSLEKKFKAHPDWFLKGITDDEKAGAAASGRTYVNNHLKDLSRKYNNADQFIGDNVACVMLELTAVSE